MKYQNILAMHRSITPRYYDIRSVDRLNMAKTHSPELFKPLRVSQSGSLGSLSSIKRSVN